MASLWKVVGGGEKGGILVRKGKDLTSPQENSRLSTDALVEEQELVGERLHYRLVTGSGPASGWVSLKLKDKDLLVKSTREERRDTAVVDEGSADPSGHSEPPRLQAQAQLNGRAAEALQRQQRVVSAGQVPGRAAARGDAQVVSVQEPGDVVFTTGRVDGVWVEVQKPLGRVCWISSTQLAPVEGSTANFAEHTRSMLTMQLAPAADPPLQHASAQELRDIIEQAGLRSEGISDEAELRRRALEVALPGPGVLQIERDGRTAHLATPRTLRRGRQLPLLLVLHGAGKTEQIITSSIGEHAGTAERHGVFVLVAEALDHTWDFITTGQRRDLDFLEFAIDEARRRFPVDDGRVAVLGYSDGASYGLSLALNNPHVFQAAMVWAAGFCIFEPRLVPTAPRPRLFVEYGRKDELFDFDTVALRTKARLEQAGYSLEFHVDEEGRHAPRTDLLADALAFWRSPVRGELGSRRPLPEGQLTAEEAVEWVLAAVDEFEALMLPLELQEDTAKVRAQYKRLSLLVHPDKCSHPEASTAFKRLFGAMQQLTDMAQQRAALRRARRKGDHDLGLDEEKWWEKATVDEMERAFREMERRYEQLGVFEFQKKSTKKHFGLDEARLWITPEDAKALFNDDLALFLDARDTSDFEASHVRGAHSLPGHTMEQLSGIERTAAFQLVVARPEQTVVVYSDNGSRLSRCTNVAQALRKRVAPERVLRLTGGLNLWKRHGFPVEGDARALFAGKVLGDSVLRLGSQGTQ